jgi:hypothetical protein
VALQWQILSKALDNVVYHKNKQIKSSYLSTADNQVDTSGTLRNYF